MAPGRVVFALHCVLRGKDANLMANETTQKRRDGDLANDRNKTGGNDRDPNPSPAGTLGPGTTARPCGAARPASRRTMDRPR